MFKVYPEIFRAYDIRGRYSKEIDADFALRFGYWFPQILSQMKKIRGRGMVNILVASDSRDESGILKSNLVRGLLINDISVIDIGKASTPMFYFAIKKNKADFGVMVTASHLSDEYAGLKICDLDLKAITGYDFKKYLSFFRRQFILLPILGQLSRFNLIDEYVDFISEKIKFSKLERLYWRKKKIFISSESEVIREIIKKLFNRIGLNFKWGQSGYTGASVIFDEDGDRVNVLDKNQKIIGGDVIGAIILEYLLRSRRGGGVVVDERSTRLIWEIAERFKSHVYYSPVGHNFFQREMQKRRALFGIEKSGHYYWRDFFGVDSGIFSFMKILQAVVFFKKDLSVLFRDYKKYFDTPEQNFRVKNIKKKISLVENKFRPLALKISKLDGLTMDFGKWRFNLRPSRTESFLRLNIEAASQKILQEQTMVLKKIIKRG